MQEYGGRSVYIAGVDEAGRGPLAGPIALAAVIFLPHFDIRHVSGIRDSKKLSSQKRELWYEKARAWRRDGFIDFAVSFGSEKVIDTEGIARATWNSLKRSLAKICKNPEKTYVFLDGGLIAPGCYPFQRTIIRGDETLSVIALASIIAKVTRDRKMVLYGHRFPGYGFEQHKGYGTVEHHKAIRRLGVSPIHRVSFLGGSEYKSLHTK